MFPHVLPSSFCLVQERRSIELSIEISPVSNSVVRQQSKKEESE